MRIVAERIEQALFAPNATRQVEAFEGRGPIGPRCQRDGAAVRAMRARTPRFPRQDTDSCSMPPLQRTMRRAVAGFDSRRLHQFLSQQYRVGVHGPCSAPASKTRSLSGEVVRPRPAPWSAPGPRLFKLWSGRAIRGGSGRGAEGLPGLSARDPGDERRHSNSRMGFGEAQDPRDRPAAV